MRAVQFTRHGGPEALELADVPDPVPAADQLILAVTAAGVNRADALQRAGHYPPPPGAPPGLGLEISGVVLSAPPGTALRPGDEVCALLDGGGYAERVAVAAGQVTRAPEGIDLVDAAALPEAACTVWSSLVDTAGLRPGETLLVHGGSGGIGTTAIQVGRALGARVLATAGGPERTARCAALGADVAIDHRGTDFVDAVRAATDGRGVDVVLDVVGGAYLGRNVATLATGGRLVVIGLQQGRRGELDLAALMAARASVHAATLRARPPAEKAAIMADVAAHVWPMVADGRVRPVVQERIPFAEAPRAHTLLEDGAVFGKLLLVP